MDEKEYLDGEEAAIIIKYNNLGKVEWHKSIDCPSSRSSTEKLLTLCNTNDGGYLVGGYFTSSYVDLGNGNRLENKGKENGMLIKYNEFGDVEWAKTVGSTGSDRITAIDSLDNGEYVVGGTFFSKKIKLENGTVIKNSYSSHEDSFILRCTENGDLTFSNQIEGVWDDHINSISSTKNGGYIVTGMFNSYRIKFNGTELQKDEKTFSSGQTGWSQSEYSSFIAAYDSNNNLVWCRKLGNGEDTVIFDMNKCEDDGYILSGWFNGDSLRIDNTKLINEVSYFRNALIIKIDSGGMCEWAKTAQGRLNSLIEGTTELDNGELIAVGHFEGDTFTMDNKRVIRQGNDDNGIVVKISDQIGVPEAQEVTVENVIKEFKITTDVQEINGAKGGSISGEDDKVYEKIKYGDSTTKDIIMVPDEGYEIVGITINDEDYPINDLPDGEFVLPKFDNVTEDKHIVVKYALATNKITINKVDKNTKEALSGAEFSIEQIETREEPTTAIGELHDNSETYAVVDTTTNFNDKLGEMTNNGTYYFIKGDDGSYTPTNGKTYQVANGGTAGIANSTANSYIKIDLSGLTGKYGVVVNASCSSDLSDYGYLTITSDTTAPVYYNVRGRFMCERGNKSAQNYTSILEGGKVYYLHLGYYKNGSYDGYNDQISIKSINLYGTVDKQFNFAEKDGKYESTNVGVDSSVSSSYLPIDLTNCTGKYTLTINAQIMSESYSDYGYVTLTQSTTRPNYNDSNGRIMQISGSQAAKTYTQTVQGGKMYYLHLGYYKDISGRSGNDKFTVNSIELTLDTSELYNTNVTTNSFGQAVTEIPYGKYKITETKAPDGYVINSEPLIIDFNNSEDAVHEFTIEDSEIAKLVVHHYIKGTTTQVAKDEISVGAAGEKYETLPKIDLSDYVLETDENGNYVLPENASGVYKDGTIEVTYYYIERPASVIVHHYYEGTTNKVVEDEIKQGKEGEKYITEPLTTNLPDGYIVGNSPENATGIFTKRDIEVIYYYAKKKVPLTINKVDENGDPVVGATFGIFNKYENIVASGEVVDDGPSYDVVDKETGELDVNKRLISTIEFYEKMGDDLPDWQYTDFEEKNGKYEAVLDYDENEDFLESYGNVEIDLSENSDKYVMEIEFDVSGGDASFGVTSSDGNGTYIGELDDKNGTFTFDQVLDGGAKYYFGVNYSYYDENNYCRVNSVKIYNIKEVQYGFDKNETGEYVSNNTGKLDTRAVSEMMLDLSDKTGTYEISVESILDGLGYASIEVYDDDDNHIETILWEEGRYDYSNIGECTAIYNKNSKYIDGGKIYILRFEYDKEGMTEPVPDDNTSDQFIISSIELKTFTNMADKTDNSGKVTFMVEPGEYDIVETGVPDGYDASEDAEQRVTVGDDGSTVTVVNRKHKGTVTVHHYIEGTTTPVPLKDGTNAEDEVLRGDVDEEYLTRELDESKSIYTVSEVPANASGKYIDGNIEVTYYYRLKDAQVVTHYYEEGTTNKLSEDKVINGKINDEYSTVMADDIPSKYELVETPANATGTMTEEATEVIYFFRKKAAQVIVRHYEEGTTNKLSEDVVIDGRIDEAYTTVPADDVPIKYELAGTPEKATGTMTEETIEVIYYYRVKSAVVNVRYLEKGTDAVLEPDEVLNGKVDEEYSTSAKDIEGYQLVEHSGNENGKFEVNPLTITYYYLYKTKATVLYIDKMTGEPIESRTEEGLVGDDFVTESKSFPNYVLVEEPDEKTVKMTKEGVTLKYYYVHVSAGVVEKHLDIISGATLHNEVHEGNEGDPYEIKSKTFDGYDLVEDKLPTNAKGTMKVDSFDVIYYYIYRTKVNAKYLDKVTGEPVADDEVINGHEGDAYETERKVVDGYKLVEVPAKADGTMTKEEIDVTYYYVHTSGGVIVNHLDVKTGKQLKDESKIEGYEGDPYETHEENIPGYELVQDRYPDNAKGTMTIDEIPVNYYYAKLSQVKVRYVDKDTGDDVAEEVVITGKEGDEYTTEAKDVPGYDLVEEPEIKDGVLKAEDDEVVYYYRRPAKVVARYFDQESGKELEAEETTSGYQNDEYVTEAKEVKYYELVATPGNASGKMTVKVTKDENGKEIVEDTTYVDYYYRKMIFNLKIDKTIASVSVNGAESVINGDLAKVEVYRKDMATAKVQIKYLIKVINDSELSGKATIMENIPAGMTMNTENNNGWAVNGSTATRETKELAPGESETFEVVLDWQNGDGNIGTKENVASIVSSENEAGFDEKDATDNEDKADVIVAISTGGHTYVMIAGGILLVLIAMACGVYIVKKQD